MLFSDDIIKGDKTMKRGRGRGRGRGKSKHLIFLKGFSQIQAYFSRNILQKCRLNSASKGLQILSQCSNHEHQLVLFPCCTDVKICLQAPVVVEENHSITQRTTIMELEVQTIMLRASVIIREEVTTLVVAAEVGH